MTESMRIIDSPDLDSHFGVLHELLIAAAQGNDEARLMGDAARASIIDSLVVTDRSVWLLLAVLTGSLPTSEQVITWRRRAAREGVAAFIAALTASRKAKSHGVRIVVGGVCVDAHHTVGTSLSTGIQRVVRNVMDRWQDTHEIAILAWDGEYQALRQVPPGSHRDPSLGAKSDRTPVIPWAGTYLLPELAVERPRLERIQALAEFSGNSSGVIGFDLVPVTSAETAGPGMPAAFSENLAAVARTDRVATISAAAGEEYSGWRLMIESAGLVGPEIVAIGLPVEPIPESADPLDPRAELGLGGAPLVVCVGSHEPRKNHLAVLHAAEIMWREGHDFELVFCGGNAWNSERFVARLGELRSAGRPVSTHSRTSDAVLDALVRAARFTVFPSLNEGYGLPVAESLAVGTPVITSNFGSMAEIAAAGGCLLVDPRNDADLAAGMRRLLVDDVKLRELRVESLARPHGSWSAYADELWAFLVG